MTAVGTGASLATVLERKASDGGSRALSARGSTNGASENSPGGHDFSASLKTAVDTAGSQKPSASADQSAADKSAADNGAATKANSLAAVDSQLPSVLATAVGAFGVIVGSVSLEDGSESQSGGNSASAPAGTAVLTDSEADAMLDAVTHEVPDAESTAPTLSRDAETASDPNASLENAADTERQVIKTAGDPAQNTRAADSSPSRSVPVDGTAAVAAATTAAVTSVAAATATRGTASLGGAAEAGKHGSATRELAADDQEKRAGAAGRNSRSGQVLTGATQNVTARFTERAGTAAAVSTPAGADAAGTALAGTAHEAIVPEVGGKVAGSDGVVLAKSPEGIQGTVPVAPQQATPSVSAVPAPQVAQPAHPPLLEQLSRPLFQLASGQAGTKVMTVQLSPDALGPVTVRAHLGSDGVRIELLAATDAGRDGLKLILSDLKRDLAAQGVSSSLQMSDSSNGGAAGQQHAFRGNRGSPSENNQWQRGAQDQLPAPPAHTTQLATTSLDITV